MEMAVRKWEKAANKVKMSGSVEKKVNRNTKKHRWAHTTFSNLKWARKFHIVVVQNNVKEMYQKVWCARARLLLLLFFLLGHVATVAKFLDQTTNQKRHLTK